MGQIAFFHPFSGASGDMALGALIGAGLPLAELDSGLRTLGVDGWRLTETQVERGAFVACRVRVLLDDSPCSGGDGDHSHGHTHSGEHAHSHSHEHDEDTHHNQHGHGHSHGHEHAHSHGHGRRGLSDILHLIDRSSLPSPVKERAAAVFRRLGAAEAHVHGMPVESVHFHEVGAVDSIVDIIGTCLGLHLLGIEAVHSAPITVGTGFVTGDHGRMPLPAPATIELLRGFPIEQRDSRAELTTPTGAALLTTLATTFGTMPPMTVARVSYGAGDDRPGPVPNILRLVIGETTARTPHGDRVLLLETNLDDMSPEWTGHLVEQLFTAGALDVWLTPILMKKGRSAQELKILAPLAREEALAALIFRESTTFGIRRHEVDRITLVRRFHNVTTPWGEVRVKVGTFGSEDIGAAPEYEDLRALATKANKPLRELHRLVMERYYAELS